MTGKGLSANDYTDAEKQKVADSQAHAANSGIHVTAEEKNSWNSKVDSVTGKGLSTNDYTDEEKQKLATAQEQILELQNKGGGVVASETAPTDTTVLWIDTANGGIAKYHNGTAWVIVASVWT